MALYRVSGTNLLQRAQGQAGGAMKSMGSMTKENQTTEINPGSPPMTQVLAQGVGLTGAANQLWNLGEKGVAGAQWAHDKIWGPKVDAPITNGETGGQAIQQAAGPMQGGVQLNSGAQIGEQMQNQGQSVPDFVNGAPTAVNQAEMNAAQALQAQIGGAENQAGQMAAESLKQQMYADPRLADPGLLSQSAEPAGQIQVAGPGNVTSGLSGMAGSAIGGVGGGLAGREIGRAVGGDTGAAIGGLAGSLGGAYLGSMAMGSLAGGVSGAAGGAATGAAAGSAVPGMGTLIGAGLGALTSFFL